MSLWNSREERLINTAMERKKINLEGEHPTPLVDLVMGLAKTQDGGRKVEDTVPAFPIDRTRFFQTVFGLNSGINFTANDIPNNFKNFALGWVKLYTPCALDMIELEMAKGGHEKVDVVSLMLGLPARDHRLKYARQLVHGQGTSNDFIGLIKMLETGTSGTSGTYGGLTRKYYPRLLPTVIDATDVAPATQSVSNVMAVESSNVLLISGDESSKLTQDYVIELSGGTGLNKEKRIIVAWDYNTTLAGYTTIWVNQAMNQTGTYTTGTIMGRLDDATLYGDDAKFTIEKLDAGYTHSRGKGKIVFCNQWGHEKIRSATNAHVQAVTEVERKTLGFKGMHDVIMYNGMRVFIEEHFPVGTFVGFDPADLRFKWLGRYSKMQFRKADGISHLFSGGELNVGAEGYVLLNVGQFFSTEQQNMFILKNAA